MKDNQTLQTDFEALCLHQKETITRQQVQIWDLEEEIRVLNRQIKTMEEAADKSQEKIDKFELWCDHQQTLINSKDIEMMNTVDALNYFKTQCQNLENRRNTLEARCNELEANCSALEDHCKGLEKGTLYFVLRKIKRIFSK